MGSQWSMCAASALSRKKSLQKSELLWLWRLCSAQKNGQNQFNEEAKFHEMSTTSARLSKKSRSKDLRFPPCEFFPSTSRVQGKCGNSSALCHFQVFFALPLHSTIKLMCRSELRLLLLMCLNNYRLGYFHNFKYIVFPLEMLNPTSYTTRGLLTLCFSWSPSCSAFSKRIVRKMFSKWMLSCNHIRVTLVPFSKDTYLTLVQQIRFSTCWETAAARFPPALSPDTAMRPGSTECWSSTPSWRKCLTTRYTSSYGTGK